MDSAVGHCRLLGLGVSEAPHLAQRSVNPVLPSRPPVAAELRERVPGEKSLSHGDLPGALDPPARASQAAFFSPPASRLEIHHGPCRPLGGVASPGSATLLSCRVLVLAGRRVSGRKPTVEPAGPGGND